MTLLGILGERPPPRCDLRHRPLDNGWVDLVGRLLEAELFAGFRREDLAPLEPALLVRTYERGACLYRAEDPVVAVYVVVSGLIKVCHVELDGSEFVVDLFWPSETIGEFPILDPTNRRAFTAIADSRTEVVVIPGEQLLRVLVCNPELLRRFAATMLRRLVRDHVAMADMQVVDLEVRLARRLLALARACGQATNEGTRIDIRPSQTVLAESIRASREHVNRALAKFVKAGLIRVRDGHIVVTDAGALTARAESMAGR